MVNSDKFIARFRNIDWLQPSVIGIIIGNLVPMAALFIFQWDVFSLIFLFWLENVIIGGFNVLKMMLAGFGAKDVPAPMQIFLSIGKLFLIPFFCVHYGMFTFVHGMFVVSMFDHGLMHHFGGLNTQLILQIVREHHLEWAFGGLVASHLISFGWDYLWKGEFRHSSATELMGQPYRRVVVMHLTVIVGGFLAMALHLPEAALAFLIALKTAADLWGHENVRTRVAAQKTQTHAGMPAVAAPTPSIENALQTAWQVRASVAQGDQPARPIPLGMLAIVVGVALAFGGGMCYMAYDFLRPFVSSHPAAGRPPAPISHKTTPGWVPIAAREQIPEVRVAGRFQGHDFHANHGTLAGSVLTLADTSGDVNRAFVFHLTAEQTNALANRIFQFGTNDSDMLPVVDLVSHDKISKSTTTETYRVGYSLQWILGVRGKKKVPLKIYFCLPDEKKSFIAGTFKVAIKMESSATDSKQVEANE